MPESQAMAQPQVFSLEEVNAIVPELTRIVGEQLDLCTRIEAMLDSLAELAGSRDLEPRGGDAEGVQALKRDIAHSIDEYHHGWTHIEEMGGVLKDPREGLVDFYGRVDNRLVWLCWKFGETQVNHYHQLDEGFSRRKRIEESGRRMMLN